MLKYHLFLLLIIFEVSKTFAQFEIKGTIHSDSGRMILIPVGYPDYYPTNHCHCEAIIHNGCFEFSDSIFYPTAFLIGLKKNKGWEYLSDIFFVENGEQDIHCNIDSNRVPPDISNQTMKEYLENFRAGYNSTESKNKGDFILNYTKSHKTSFVALWELIHIMKSGYDPIYDSIYAQFDESIKNTFTGKIVEKKLSESKFKTVVGAKFPLLPLHSININKVIMPVKKENKKYMLIDFWYSHCGACISQFDELKAIYNEYEKLGFQIYGISIDSELYKKDWLNAINKFKLPWTQFWDINGLEAKKLFINSYPTNFLLDKNGVIIKKDISPEELKDFLKNSIR